VLGLLLFGDVPSTRTMVGAAIIVGAGLFILLRQRQTANKPSA
jgi:drug/metabolite transporter (DMT)-like permease